MNNNIISETTMLYNYKLIKSNLKHKFLNLPYKLIFYFLIYIKIKNICVDSLMTLMTFETIRPTGKRCKEEEEI